MMDGSCGPLLQTPLQLKNEWAGFDLVKVGGQPPMTYRRGDIFCISGCITTVCPMKNQAGWDLAIGWVDVRCQPSREVFFLGPTQMSRYEGIYQQGTSVTLRPDGRVTIYFTKNTNPMVLHFSGLCCVLSNEDPIPIPVAMYELRDWVQQLTRQRQDNPGAEEAPRALEAEENSPPALHRCGNIVFLQGELKEATFGPLAQHVGTLPEGLRPRREVRWITNLLHDDPRFVDHSVAVTLRQDGRISVQGGKVHMVDQKGNMRVLQQKKRGRLCLDGIRFALVEGVPVKLSHLLSGSAPAAAAGASMKSKVGYLIADGSETACTAVCMKQGDIVLLEGHLAWSSLRPPNAKQPLATLPQGCWPQRRETFFTRGSSDFEERRRVDVDVYGRIFCPEGAAYGRVELTGVLFVAGERTDLQPRDPDWDDLKLHYHSNEVNVVSTSFDGHELLEQFVRRSNFHEWRFIDYDFGRHAGRKMLLPLGQVALRGHEKWDPMNLGTADDQLWRRIKSQLSDHYGLTSFHTLLHISDGMFDRITKGINMQEEHRRYLAAKRIKVRQEWSTQRQPGLTFSYLQGLATEIVDQMFEHWDFKAQLQGALLNDFRAPSTIEHLFPQRKSGQDWFIKKRVREHDMAKFEEIRQFFFLYETTGSNMTHCSLMGSSDVFTTTGKWYFPDAPEVQKLLFENIAWLFPRGVYLFISERQTPRFPFIEDLDIQARMDWQGPLPEGEKPRPPDDLIMDKPRRVNGKVEGDPGDMMRRRAMAVHMVYPMLDHLEVIVYSASGLNKGKEMLKSSFHLVWPQLIVDPDRAPVIRHVTLGMFQKETMVTGSFLGILQNRLLQLHESNNWELVFDSTTINARNGLRLPYSDKASMVIATDEDKKKVKEGTLSKTKAPKKRVREDRPSVAIGMIRFEFDKEPETGNDFMSSAAWVHDRDDKRTDEWISMGTCRRDMKTSHMCELTPWQLGPDVLAMLPTKPGEQFYFEGEDDGEGGHWVTHKPFPYIRRCAIRTQDFRLQFNEALSDEQDALKEEFKFDTLQRIIGSWVHLTEAQAIWRVAAATQCDAKVPDWLWARGARSDLPKIQRPAEIVFLKSKGKVLIDGPQDVVEVLIRVLKTFTKPDDNAVMPIYDLTRISA